MLKFNNSSFSVLLVLCVGAAAAIKNENNESVKEFRYCLRKSPQPNLRDCIGRTAISFLQRFDETDKIIIADDFIATRDDTVTARSFVNFLDTDPVDFRGILENAGAVFSQRSLEFHMDTIYPGLMFKIGPSADSSSVAEFVIDPTVNERHVKYEELSTARILTRHYILPFLLGLKFNLVALVPILFTVICLLLKKSLFIAKLVIYISSILGVGGIAGALGQFGGFGNFFSGHSLGGEIGGIPAAAHGPAFGAAGIFPAKDATYAPYDQDDLQHISPYKRHDRKVVFGQTRGNKKNNIRTAVGTALLTPSADNFYEYEKQAFLQDRSVQVHNLNEDLVSTTFDGNKKEKVFSASNVPVSYRTSDNNGWKALNVRA